MEVCWCFKDQMPQMSVEATKVLYGVRCKYVNNTLGDGNVVTICQRERQKHNSTKFTKSFKHVIYTVHTDYDK